MTGEYDTVSVQNTLNGFGKFTDKYFLRTRDILRRDGLNRWVRAQVFVRTGPGEVAGMDEAVRILDGTSLREHGGRVHALPEGARYGPGETLMVIEAPIDDIVHLETVYLGVLSAATTERNDGTAIDLGGVEGRVREIVEAASGRPVSYFGARHWRWQQDADIAAAAYRGGATSCSTDAGAEAAGQRGIGTIPHALENIYAAVHGKENAVVEATRAFDRHIDPQVPRVALIDYNNHEVDDAIATAESLDGRLAAVRIDTCGENVGQGAIRAYDAQAVRALFGRDLDIPEQDRRFWFGNGVTVTGTYAVRRGLDDAGHADVDIILTSGFGDPEKVRAFTRAEDIIGQRLYDGLGVGGVFHSRAATMDIVAVGERPDALIPLAKTGRGYRPNDRLTQVI